MSQEFAEALGAASPSQVPGLVPWHQDALALFGRRAVLSQLLRRASLDVVRFRRLALTEGAERPAFTAVMLRDALTIQEWLADRLQELDEEQT